MCVLCVVALFSIAIASLVGFDNLLLLQCCILVLLIVPTPVNCFSYFQVMENGLFYLVSVEGQKTGFYADQRESRHFISTLSKDQKVLDLCCYSGGFALSAAKGGATNVIGIDSSGSALDLANENILLNKFDPERISFIKQDASAFMKGAISRSELWDLVVLDPPKLAPRKKVYVQRSIYL